MIKLNNIDNKAKSLHSNLLGKAVKGIAVGALSLGMLGGISTINTTMNNNTSATTIHADSNSDSGFTTHIAPSDAKYVAETEQEDKASDEANLKLVIKYALSNPDDATQTIINEPKLFSKGAPILASHWTPKQKEEFWRDSGGVNIDDDTPQHPINPSKLSDAQINAMEPIKSHKSKKQANYKINKHINRHDKNVANNHKAKRAFKRAKKSKQAYKHHRKSNKRAYKKRHRKYSNKYKISKQQANQAKAWLKRDKRALKSKKAKKNASYRKLVIKNEKLAQKLLK